MNKNVNSTVDLNVRSGSRMDVKTAGNGRLCRMLSCLCTGLFFMTAMSITAVASTSSKEYLDTLNTGVAALLDPAAGRDGVQAARNPGKIPGRTNPEGNTVSGNLAHAGGGEKRDAADTAADRRATEKKEAQKKETDLVMADVQNALNVRAEADEESEKVGLLYRDCGGRILERKDGWTKLQSGGVIGWAKDDYLLFNDDAKRMAEEVGNLIVTIETDALRVRKEPSTDAGIYVVMAQDDELNVIEVVDDDWISVEYEDEIGYVSSEYVNMDFHIDAGETIAAIKAREKTEAEAKAKLTADQGAVVVGADDTRLLASLIYCEAGNQGYEGQLAVGAAVMNRVRSGAYPNSVTGVIYASGQFPPALNGKVARAYSGSIPESCIKAAQETINGATNIGTATHFKRAGVHDGVVIGDHVFW